MTVKPCIDILSVIREMALYWNLTRGHEQRTVVTFKKLAEDISSAPLNSITPQNLLCLYHLLRGESEATDESIKRKFSYVKRVLKYAQAKGYIKQNPCDLIKLPKARRAKINSLTKQEVEIIEDTAPGNECLQRVKHYFLFQCYTGLAFTDFTNFKKESIVYINGKQYIAGHRRKTEAEYFLPLQPKALHIAETYNYNFKCCLQVYNRELKNLQKLAGIEKRLTSHVGRRTFGQTMIDDSVPLEVVSKMLGHSSTAMTEKYYARVGMQRVIRDMERLAA